MNKKYKILLCVVLSIFVLALGVGVFMNMPQGMTISEFRKFSRRDKFLRPRVALSGKVVTAKETVWEIKTGGAKMKDFVLQDGTGAVRLYYDPAQTGYEPKIGDTVRVTGEMEIVLGYGKTFKLIITDIEKQ